MQATVAQLPWALVARSRILPASPQRSPAIGPGCRDRDDQRLPQVHDADSTATFAFHESEPENIRVEILPYNGRFTNHAKQSLHRLRSRFRLERHEKDWLPDRPA